MNLWRYLMDKSNWKDCLEDKFARKRSPDKFRAKSLVETAKGRLKYASEKEITPENISYVFENYYSSLIEFLHSLVLLKGYSIENHLCLGYFLRDILKKNKLYRIFNDCRIKRNLLLYYGKKLEFSLAKKTISKIKFLLREIENLIKNDF